MIETVSRFLSFLLTRCQRVISYLPVIILAWILTLWIKIELWIGITSLPHLVRRIEVKNNKYRLFTPQDAVRVVRSAVPSLQNSDKCLLHALVLFGLISYTGREAAFYLGVKSPTHKRCFAHAWVEIDGTPLDESTDPCLTHSILFSYPPSARRASSHS